MYSYKYLAAVWKQLQDRTDITSVLREVIGQHVLCDLGQEDDAHTTQTIVWIKAIYDLQRCYLCGADPSDIQSQIAPSLLPFELLYSSILYLIEVKVKHFPSQTALLTKVFTRPRLILAQAVLSGLRLLTLHKSHITAQQRQRLRLAFNEAWKDDVLQGAEGCMVQNVFAAIMDLMTEIHHVDAYRAERESASLPIYASGLYPLQIKPEISVTPLIHALAEEDDDWIDAYFVLYDTIWTIECALTQRYIDVCRENDTLEPEPGAMESDEVFEQLYQQRSSFAASAFHVRGPMVPSDPLMESLAIHLLDWDVALDSFLSRQDSIVQNRMSLPRMPSNIPNYGKQITKLKPYFETALQSFADWLLMRTVGESPPKPLAQRRMSERRQSEIAPWISRMASPNSTLSSQHFVDPDVSVYIVGCPKLHAVPKTFLAEQLRWTDKWAYEGVEDDTPILSWKEGVQCPGCPTGEKIKCARLLEPLRAPSPIVLRDQRSVFSPIPHSGESSSSYFATVISTASHSASDFASSGINTSNPTIPMVEVPETRSEGSTHKSVQGVEAHPPQYSASPISPMTSQHTVPSFGSSVPEWPVSPLAESFNALPPISSRLSMNLPIPVVTPDETPGNMTSSASQEKISMVPDIYPSSLTWSADTMKKAKITKQSSKLGSSMRRKPSNKIISSIVFPKDTTFVFSSSGASLLLWGKAGDHVARFEVFGEGELSNINSCKYEAEGIEAVAAGTRKCVIVTSKSPSSRMLKLFDGLDPNSRNEIELEVTGRTHEMSVAVSKNDEYLAVSLNDQIDLFGLKDGLKRVAFHHQMDVFELRGGVSRRRSIPVARTTSDDTAQDSEKTSSGSWFASQSKALNFQEASEEQQRQTAIISRKVYFSTDSQRLVSATQLGDHCVYIDVWDITREPVSTISEHSRSFKLPPWVLNDGDLTGVFYDSLHRAALVTAFIGKEYPMFVPFPGYAKLQNETFSTKIVSAAMSPSGSVFVIANAMTEMIHFEYTKGVLSPRKMKKSSSKISNGAFKPGAISLAMPRDDTVLVFWIKDGKCMLRTIRLGGSESIRDMDIRAQYDMLMRPKERTAMAGASSLSIAELDT